MNFQAKATEVTKVEADMLAVFATFAKDSSFTKASADKSAVQTSSQSGFVLTDEAKKIDSALGGMLSEVAKTEDFEAKEGKYILLHTHGKIPANRILLAGIGDPKEISMFDWQTVAAGVGRKAKEIAAKRLAITLPGEVFEKLGTDVAARGAVEGVTLGTYVFLRHKSEQQQKKEKYLEEVWLLTAPARLDNVSSGIQRGQVTAEAVVFARDLVNEPPSTTTPAYLAQVAGDLAKGKSNISASVFGPDDLKRLGMGALLGIARGSDEEPRFIKLTYKGGGRKTVCLVGKGITFDTGGLSLKSWKSMETMKCDMAAAAALFGIFKALAILKPKANVVGLIVATENMPSGRAIKPGDVVRAYNGKTIEILNTDAEGRVILADALSYAADKVKPDIIIDIATLTGACMVALGEEIAGLFSTDMKLSQMLKGAAVASGEKFWELPIAQEYEDQLKSTVADVSNTHKTKYGGAIMGALFLKEFVPEGTPWAHLDIAGPAFAEKDAPLTPVGGTGFGVRMLLEYLRDL